MVIGLFLVAMALSANGCNKSDNSSVATQVKQTPAKRQYLVQVKTIEESGDKVSVQVTVFWLGPPPPPSEVRLIWNPAQNSGHRSWEGGKAEVDDDGNWYAWTLPINPATGRTGPLTLGYKPYCPTFDCTGTYAATDTFVATDGADNWGNTSITHKVSDKPPAVVAAPSAPAGERSEALVSIPSLQLADYYLWQTRLWFFSSETTMTTNLCQEWVDRLQSESFFIAARFPVQPPTLAYTDPYSLPVVFGEEFTPSLVLLDRSQWPSTPELTASLEYKPRHFSFLENELPSAPGEHWLALGVVPSPTLTCPAGLNLGPDEWAFRSQVFLDLGGVKDTCADCILPFYYCYEGQESPLAAALLSEMLPGDVSITSHQGWGITCLGPQPFRLLDDAVSGLSPAFDLHGANTAFVTPTQVISLHHYLRNLRTEPVTITFDYASELGIPWTIYSGTLEGPVSPIEGSLVLTGSERSAIWMVAEIPVETPFGAETVLITATNVMSDAQLAWASDVLWVGEWVAPPQPAWSAYSVYLPLVLR